MGVELGRDGPPRIIHRHPELGSTDLECAGLESKETAPTCRDVGRPRRGVPAIGRPRTDLPWKLAEPASGRVPPTTWPVSGASATDRTYTVAASSIAAVPDWKEVVDGDVPLRVADTRPRGVTAPDIGRGRAVGSQDQHQWFSNPRRVQS